MNQSKDSTNILIHSVEFKQSNKLVNKIFKEQRRDNYVFSPKAAPSINNEAIATQINNATSTILAKHLSFI